MASQQILLSTKAADIQQGSPTTNHGSHADIAVRWNDSLAGYRYRALIEFDLAQLIPKTAPEIVQARLRVSFDGNQNYHSDTAYNISCHRVTAAWIEEQVTWNSRQTGTAWGTTGGDFSSPAVVTISSPDNASAWGTDYFDITQLVKDWLSNTYPNNGLLLKCEVESGLIWARYESDDSAAAEQYKPALVVDYVAVPAAPTGLLASTNGANRIDLSWTDNANNETGFRIQRKLGAGGTWAQIDTVGANVTTYTDTTVVGNAIYYYRVCAYNADGDSAWSNEGSATAVQAAPTALSATSNGANRIDLSWTDNASDETGFKIQRKLGAVGTWQQIDTVGVSVNSYTDTTVIGNATYHYRVCAYNGDGDSAWSNEDSASAIQAAPTALSAIASGQTVNLAWADNATDETGYKVERKPEGGAYAQIGTAAPNATSYTDEGISSGAYYYRVRAYNDYGDSAYSNEASATIQAVADDQSDTAAFIRRRRR